MEWQKAAIKPGSPVYNRPHGGRRDNASTDTNYLTSAPQASRLSVFDVGPLYSTPRRDGLLALQKCVIKTALCLADITISIAFDCGQKKYSILIRQSSHHLIHDLLFLPISTMESRVS